MNGEKLPSKQDSSKEGIIGAHIVADALIEEDVHIITIDNDEEQGTEITISLSNPDS